VSQNTRTLRHAAIRGRLRLSAEALEIPAVDFMPPVVERQHSPIKTVAFPPRRQDLSLGGCKRQVVSPEQVASADPLPDSERTASCFPGLDARHRHGGGRFALERIHAICRRASNGPADSDWLGLLGGFPDENDQHSRLTLAAHGPRLGKSHDVVSAAALPSPAAAPRYLGGIAGVWLRFVAGFDLTMQTITVSVGPCGRRKIRAGK
jgi:hypothetical protein